MKNRPLDLPYLRLRARQSLSRGYEIPMWVLLCADLIKDGYKVELYEAKTTYSKYIYVSRNRKTFKVRISNHKPNKFKETTGDCDFFVGITHTGVRTTGDAYDAIKEFFGDDKQIQKEPRLVDYKKKNGEEANETGAIVHE